jgi:hypothetical protein
VICVAVANPFGTASSRDLLGRLGDLLRVTHPAVDPIENSITGTIKIIIRIGEYHG